VPVRPGGAADFLAALSGRVVDKTYVDAGWQYNPRDQHTERLVVGGRWQPDIAKVLNASYRFSRDSSLGSVEVPGIRQIDVSGQWPLGQGWYGVGRYNYSLRESKLIETVGGLEYNGGCWVARFVVQRFATTTGTANTAFFAQLELNEFSRIGSNPLEMLKRNIPGYGRINQPTADPAFGAN
jgi:LPS-assembly protein